MFYFIFIINKYLLNVTGVNFHVNGEKISTATTHIYCGQGEKKKYIFHFGFVDLNALVICSCHVCDTKILFRKRNHETWGTPHGHQVPSY